jgi:peptide/nickel transport system permease protein
VTTTVIAPGAAPSGTPSTVDEYREAWAAQDLGIESRSFWAETFHRFLRNKLGVVSAGVLLLLVVGAIFAPLITRADPLVGNPVERLRPLFSSGHPLGTDEQGRDMLARVLYGGRLSLIAAFVPTVAATVIGTFIGMWSGFLRGRVGSLIMRAVDMLYAFPAILLAIAVGASLGPGLKNTIIAVTIVFIPPIARVADSATRTVVLQEYMEAARLSGAGRWRLLRTQLLPNVLNQIIVYASGLVGVSMIIAASLSFLGLGSQPPAPEWGYMLNSMRGSIYVAPAVVVIPGIFIFITSVAFNTAADSLRESMDARSER